MVKTKIATFDRGKTEAGNKIVEKWEMVHTRKIDRMVLRNRLKKKMNQFCKHGYSGAAKHEVTKIPSWFAEHWKEIRKEVIYG